MEKVVISGKKCFIWKNGSSGTTVFWPFEIFESETLAEIDRQIMEGLRGLSFQIIAFEIDDWDNELSPWKADGPDGKPRFGGEGKKTLQWIMKQAVPWVQQNSPEFSQKLCITGYSLAGLFALWTFYETGIFIGCASCSGTMWFPKWDVYSSKAQAPEGSRVYMSLGGKEPHVKNQVMATIGERTMRQAALLGADPNIKEHIFEWNPGGHFAASEKRVVKGIRWLLR